MKNITEKVVDRVLKEANVQKNAKFFEVGDEVTLVDQVQGLNKGSIYKVVKNDVPGKITIAEIKGYAEVQPSETTEAGTTLGEYDVDRFVKYNHEV